MVHCECTAKILKKTMMHTTVVSRQRPFDDAITSLNQIQYCFNTDYHLITGATATCRENLEVLRSHLSELLTCIPQITSSDSLHWLARVLLEALYNEFTSLRQHIDQLFTLLDKHTLHEPMPYSASQTELLFHINKVNDLTVSTLSLEQRVLRPLQDMNALGNMDNQTDSTVVVH